MIAREFALAAGFTSLRVFPLYNELTSRDVLQKRIIDEQGNTSWSDTPLTLAAREGGLCILDGIHTLDVHVLYSLRRLLLDGIINLPSGETITIGMFNLINELITNMLLLLFLFLLLFLLLLFINFYYLK